MEQNYAKMYKGQVFVCVQMDTYFTFYKYFSVV